MEQPTSNVVPPEESTEKTISRRELLKAIAATGGAVTAAILLPGEWVKPVVEVGLLPAHAQVSPVPTPIRTPTPTPPLGSKFAVMGTAGDGNLIVVFPTADEGLPTPTQNTVPGLPGGADPHGVAYFGTDGGLVSDFGNSRIFVVNLSTNSLVDTISTAPDYNGMGTIAVAPGSAYALACGASSTLIVITEPFNAASTITSVTLPGEIRSYQTQAIVFNNARRAFVYHTTGISVLDPPYNTIAFTIPVFNPSSRAIAISSDGNTLLATSFSGTLLTTKQTSADNDALQASASTEVLVFTAPFSASSTPDILAISAADRLDGIMITPDGSKALVCNSWSPHVYTISAPFSSASTVEEIPLPAALTSGPGFEDVGISADGELAIITGQSIGTGLPAAFILAPFTASGATVFAVDIVGGGRGAGAVRFQPPGT